MTKHRTRSMPIKRIQRNARPSDAYNDRSMFIPSGPERSGSINVASDKHPISQADAAHGRMRMEREQFTPETVHKADTVLLLRERARTLRAKYESMWRCASNGRKIPFDFKSPEGDGTDAEIIEVPRRNKHEIRLDNLYASMNPAALTR